MSSVKIVAPFVRSPYNYDVMAASDEAAVRTVGASLTVQSMTEDADINVLMSRFGLTGKMPENMHERVPMYGDFTQVGDYREALEAVRTADAAFMAMPASVRARFDNDPQKLLEFVHDDANLEEAMKLGLRKPPPPAPEPEKVMKVEVVAPATPPPKAGA